MRRKAYAKITLTVQAVKRDADTIHFDNIILPIDLFDMVYLDEASEMSLQTNKDYLPLDERNTVYKAILLMKEQYGIVDNFAVRVVKNIPAQAGLGGGSADAAAIINMLDEKYHLKLSLEEKIAIGRQIDEDTPFCLANCPARVEGMGDLITPIALNTSLHYLVIKPAYGISTKRFLRKLNRFSPKEAITNGMIEACAAGDYQGILEHRYNALQRDVMAMYPKLRQVVRRMENLGMEGICMSGTGTSIVGLSQDIAVVRNAYEKLALKYPFTKYGTIKAQDVIE